MNLKMESEGMKCGMVLDKIYRYTVGVLMIVITGVLFAMALCGTSFISQSEHTTYRSDNFIVQLAAVLAVTAITFAAVRLKKQPEFRKAAAAACILLGIFLFALIVGTQMAPGSDSGMICAVARRIIRNDLSEDFTQTTIRYMQKYPNQNGMVVFIWALFNFIGTDNYIALQLINLAALFIAYYYIYRLIKEVFGEDIAAVSVIVMCMFLPFSIYVMFVYGTMLGMACAMAACYMLVRFVRDGHMRHGVLSAVMVALACVFKSNYMIVFAALLITELITLIKTRSRKMLAAAVLMTALNMMVSPLTSVAYTAISGDAASDGVPHLAWVAMGLQESPGRAEGWYNGYNDRVYADNNGDTAAESQQCREYLRQRIPYMLKNPAYTVKFFAKKTASQWNNPTFECFTFIGDMQTANHKVMPSMEAIYTDGTSVNSLLIKFMNIMQSVILGGAFAYFVLNFKRSDLQELIYALIFVGGFLFHFMWEAKCQYTVVYILLLIPYAVMGYNAMCRRLQERGR